MLYVNILLTTNNYIIDMFDNSNNLSDLKVHCLCTIYSNQGVDYTFNADNNSNKFVQFYTDLKTSDVIVIKAHQKLQKIVTDIMKHATLNVILE